MELFGGTDDVAEISQDLDEEIDCNCEDLDF